MAGIRKIQTLAEHTATGAGTGVPMEGGNASFQASGANNGGTFTSATIAIEVTNDDVNWLVLGTISLVGDGDSDGFTSTASWKSVRSNATAFSETGSTPTVTVTMTTGV